MSELELRYDRAADAVSVRFDRGRWHHSKELDHGRRVDYAEDGSVVGVELLGVSNGVDIAGLPEAEAIASALRREGIEILPGDAVAARAAARLANDPSWQRNGLARAVAAAIADYRARHSLTIRALAERLGMQHPAVARLEAGTHNPSLEMLERLSSALGLRFQIDIRPGTRPTGALPLTQRTVVQDEPTAAGGRRVVAVFEDETG